MSSCSKFHSSDVSDQETHSKTSLCSSVTLAPKNTYNGRDDMVDPPQVQSRNHYTETLTLYSDTGDSMHLKVTDLYVRDNKNFSNSARKNLGLHKSIINLTYKLIKLSERLKKIEHFITESKSKPASSQAANVQNSSNRNVNSVKSVYDKQNHTFLSKIANSVKNFQNSKQESKKDKIKRFNFWTNSQVYSLHSKTSNDLCPPNCSNKGFCSLDFAIPNKLRNMNCPYQANKIPAKPKRQSGSGSSSNTPYETLTYVLEMLTDRTDVLLTKVMKLEVCINKSNKKHRENIQAMEINCETMFEEVRRQKEEIRKMTNMLKSCSVSYKTLTTDFSQLQSKLSKMNDNIQKILLKMDQPETNRPSSSNVKPLRDSVKFDRTKKSSNRSSLIRGAEKKSKEITMSLIQDDMVASTPLEVEPNKQDGNIVKPAVPTADNQEFEYQTNENSLVDNSYIQNKTKRTVRCCNQKECHSASPWMSADLTSLSEFSFDMCTSCTNTTDCENYALLAGKKLMKKKPLQKSPKSSNTPLASATTKKTTYVLCKCMGGVVCPLLPQAPQPPVIQRSQSVQVSNMALGRSLMRSEAEVTQVIYSKSMPMTRESKVTQTKEKKKQSSCLCCPKKQKSENSIEYMIQGKPAARDHKKDTEPDVVNVPTDK